MFKKKKKDDTVVDGYFMLEKHIIESIKLLASPPELQLSLFPDFVCKPYEIASSLDDWLLMYNSEPVSKKEPLFIASELNVITELNNMLKNFDQFDQFERSEDAVRTSERWEEVRKFAKQVLSILGIEYSVPAKRSV